jgi:cytochrome c-type biogenesis protein CcmH/NrfF
MEKCQICGNEFSVTSRREEKDLEEFHKVTGKMACFPCQKKVKQRAQDEIIQGLIKEAMKRRTSGAEEEDVIQQMIEENDPLINQILKGVSKDGKR